MQTIGLYITLQQLKLKVVKVTQPYLPHFKMVFQEQAGGIGFKNIIQKLVFNLLKDYRFIKQKGLLGKYGINFIANWKTCTHNINIHQITFGIRTK
jgi:hypothetical protein